MQKFIIDEIIFFFVNVSNLKKIFIVNFFVFSININISMFFEISLFTLSTNVDDLIIFHDWWKFITNIHSSIILSFDVSKRIISNDIIIYDDISTYNRLFIVAKIFFDIWRNNENIVNISKKNWMSISIVTNVKTNASKIYFFESKNRAIINKKFDRLHVENKINWITKFTSYEYFVFVIWKTIHVFDKFSKRKNKIVVNIRKLNKISMFDAYSMILQNNIIILIMNSFYIFFMNATFFFINDW